VTSLYDASSDPLDQREAQCPYCHGSLKKVPGAKTKCPHCHEAIFVRTRPKDGARVVVTADGARQFDKEWAVWNDLGWWIKNSEEVRNTYADFMPPLPDKLWTTIGCGGKGDGDWTPSEWARRRGCELLGMVRGPEGQLTSNPDSRWAVSDSLRENIKEVIASSFDGVLYPFDRERSYSSERDIVAYIQTFLDREYGQSTDRSRVIKARVIAQTEIMRAQMGSHLNQCRQFGIVKRVRWVGSLDGSCAACTANNGVEVEFGSHFPSGARSPLDTHPLCRCVLTAVV
jgi:hypothetical protein